MSMTKSSKNPEFYSRNEQWSLRIKGEEGAEISTTTIVNIVQSMNKKWASKDKGHIELHSDLTREDSLYSIYSTGQNKEIILTTEIKTFPNASCLRALHLGQSTWPTTRGGKGWVLLTSSDHNLPWRKVRRQNWSRDNGGVLLSGFLMVCSVW